MVKRYFNILDGLLYERINILYNIMDIVKDYEKVEFDNFSNKLYDYKYDYLKYSNLKKIKINDDINIAVRKVLLLKVGYSEIKGNIKFTRLENQLVNCSNFITNFSALYNNSLDRFDKIKSNIICRFLCEIKLLRNEDYIKINI